jgi:hypothetical protein
MTPNAMPHTVKVPAIKRGPRTIRNTQMADQLKEKFK